MPEFMAPEGAQIPEDLEKGDEFDALGTFCWEGGRKLTLKAIDGHTIPGYGKRGERSDGDEDADEPLRSKLEKAYAERDAKAY